MAGLPPNLAEIAQDVRRGHPVGEQRQGHRELGYAPRDLATGARDAFGPA